MRTTSIGVLMVCAGLAMQGCNRGSDTSNNAASTGQTGTASLASEAAPLPGLAIYNRSCVSCHSMGAAGAPRLGDKTAWAPRIAKGRDALLQSVLHGVPPGMPAKGLCTTCSDDELRQVIAYMISKSE